MPWNAHGGHWPPHEPRARIHALSPVEKQLKRQQERLLEAYLAVQISNNLSYVLLFRIYTALSLFSILALRGT